MMDRLSGFRILPALMIFAAICFGVRFNDFLGNIATGTVYAAQNPSELNALEAAAGNPVKQVTPSEDPAATPPALPKTGEGAAASAGKPVIEAPSLGAPPSASNKGSVGSPPKHNSWRGADDLDDEYSDVKMELFEDLSKRRKDIEAQEKQLVVREALLKTASAELEQKYKELETLKTDIEALLVKQTEQEDARITSLVKIYEGMKAKDAARIFDSLDMDVLLQVVTKMSERKSAPIIAAMDPERARNVTIMLAEQNKLPTLPALPTVQ
jgi:flagellar motility protein MotE (MotC chaperone)